MPPDPSLFSVRQTLCHCRNFLVYVVRRYRADGCNHSAAALTYTSLFAVVPLMTVMYAILSAVPSFQSVGGDIEAMIFDYFLPSTGQEIKEYLRHFSQQAQQLTTIGIGFLAVTALLMLKNIETIFNKIWRTRGNRKGLASFLLYWAVLSLGPLFLGAALAISTYLTSLKLFVDGVDQLAIGHHLLRYGPWLLTSAAFSLLFAAVPNCRVPARHAIAGGLLTALVFECAKWIFTHLMSNTSFEFIYGTFAAIPLFLMWIYVSWLIVLAGAEWVQALSGYRALSQHPHSRLTVVLALLELLAQRYRDGRELGTQTLLRQPWLFDRYSLNADEWTSLRDKLLDTGFIRAAGTDSFVLGRDLQEINLWQLCCLFAAPGDSGHIVDGDHPLQDGGSPTQASGHWYLLSQRLLGDSEQQCQQQLAISLNELFADSERDDA